MQIDPWGSSQYQDYARLRDEFGIGPFGPDDWGVFEHPHDLLRRSVVFGQRDFDRVRDAVRGHDPWAVMTGLMPSGPMHLGHKMLLDQVVAHQGAGADVHLAVADFEAAAARGMSLSRARELAIDQYIRNYLALGVEPGRSEVYFQTTRHRVKDLAHRFATRLNFGYVQKLYGFGAETSLAHIQAPIIQAADILHVQMDERGPRPVLVPVGVDQDPHLRLTRDIAQMGRRYNIHHDREAPVPRHIVVVRGDEAVPRWLDVAEAVLDDLGIATRAGRTRKDSYARITLGRELTAREVRDLDLALARAEARKDPDGLPLIPPSATFHRFMTGLTGDKMSSSRPESSVFLTDTPDEAAAKVRRSVTGGRDTADQQRKHGAEPEKCPVYEMYLYHLARDDAHLQEVHDECRGGERLCGGCKGEAIDLLRTWLTEHREKRDQTAHLVDELVAAD